LDTSCRKKSNNSFRFRIQEYYNSWQSIPNWHFNFVCMETQNKLQIADDLVLSKIYVIRNQKVMLDRDLAALYGVETKQLKRQVNRNSERFPEDFMFELTKTENDALRSQFGTLKRGEHSKFLPYAFSEHGVLMLSSVLMSENAIKVNIQIMRIFTKIRQSFADTTELRLAVEEIRRKTENNTKNIEVVFQYLDELFLKKEDPQNRTKIGYKVRTNNKFVRPHRLKEPQAF
jgi:cell division protein FtsL